MFSFSCLPSVYDNRICGDLDSQVSAGVWVHPVNTFPGSYNLAMAGLKPVIFLPLCRGGQDCTYLLPHHVQSWFFFPPYNSDFRIAQWFCSPSGNLETPVFDSVFTVSIWWILGYQVPAELLGHKLFLSTLSPLQIPSTGSLNSVCSLTTSNFVSAAYVFLSSFWNNLTLHECLIA